MIVVHCKSGLGISMTFIGAYMLKHYGMPFREFIAWARLNRPGSVVGVHIDYLQ